MCACSPTRPTHDRSPVNVSLELFHNTPRLQIFLFLHPTFDNNVQTVLNCRSKNTYLSHWTARIDLWMSRSTDVSQHILRLTLIEWNWRTVIISVLSSRPMRYYTLSMYIWKRYSSEKWHNYRNWKFLSDGRCISNLIVQ